MRNMRQDRIRKEDRKEERRQKREALAKYKKEDGIKRSSDGQVSCCIPLVQCTRVGHPIPQSLDEGIKLECTNVNCPFVKHLVHPECFRSLEQGLMTILTNQGSARGWTDGHRKANLWSKKGLSLVQRSLRCACKKGQVKRDDEAWKERIALCEPAPKEKKEKKKHKPNTLPALQFANSGSQPTIDLKKVHELDTHYLSTHSPPPSEACIEDRYGPLKAARGRRPRRTTVASGHSTRTSASKASSCRKPSKPVGYAPIITPKPNEKSKQSDSASVSPQLNHTEEEEDEEFRSSALLNSTTPQPLMNFWKRPQPKVIKEIKELIPSEEEERPISPTNTTSSETSYKNMNSSSSISPFLQSIAIQTDETSFPKAVLKNPGLKMYLPIKQYDSESRNVISPPVATDSFVQPSDITEMLNENYKMPIAPPPGFTPVRKIAFKPTYQMKEEMKPKHVAPIPIDPVPCYSLFDGPSYEIGREILRRIQNRTLINY